MHDAFCVDIHGDSMWPTICDGERLTFRAHHPGDELLVGDVVIAHHPFKTDVIVVKRIARMIGERLFLEGDHPDPLASEDSHNFGPIHQHQVFGVWLHSNTI